MSLDMSWLAGCCIGIGTVISLFQMICSVSHLTVYNLLVLILSTFDEHTLGTDQDALVGCHILLIDSWIKIISFVDLLKLKVDSMVSLLFVEHKILCILSPIFILWINCSLKIRKMAKHYICTGYTFANEFQYCNFYWIDDNWWPWILNKPLRNCDIHT